jgi:hypothetical protein
LERLMAILWTQAKTSGASPMSFSKLEVPVTYVSSLVVNPTQFAVEDLYPRTKRAHGFYVWSVNRADFGLSAQVVERDGKPDPCFRCEVVRLTPEERNHLALAERTRVLSGYRVRVEVSERLSDSHQMDLGPFRRRVQLTSDPGLEPTQPVVTGTVRGEVTIGNPEDNDRIALGSFRAGIGKKHKVVLTTTDQGVELLTDGIEVEPSYVKANLRRNAQKGSGGSWELEVEVPPNSAAGPFPPQSAVYLKVKGSPPRRIRIPITGTAYFSR